MKVLLISVLVLLLVAGVSATDILVYNNVEKHDGWPYLSGPKIVINLDSGIYITEADDVGFNANMDFMDGINGSFSQVSGYDSTSEQANYWTMWSVADTVYSILIDESGDEHFLYKFFGASLVCIDKIGVRTNSFGFGSIATNGSEWVATHKIATTFQGVYQLNSATICDADSSWNLVDSFAYSSGAQFHLRAVPILGGLTVWNVYDDEIHIIEDDGTLNEDAMTGAFPNSGKLWARPVNAGDAGWDVCMVPVEPDGSGDSVMFAITDSVTLEVEVFLAIVDSSDGSITMLDSAVVTGGDRATNHFDDSTGWATPSLTMTGSGVVLTRRGHADTSAFGVARIEYYICTDRGDLSTFGSMQTVAIDGGNEGMGELMAPWRGVTHSDNPNDSTILPFAWQEWDGLSTVWVTPDTIAIPGAVVAEAAAVPNFIHSIDGAGLRQSAEGVSVIHGPL